MRLRLLAALLTSTLALCAAPEGTAPASGATIVRVWGDYVPAESFERIAEYFGAPESHPGRSILRTQPARRAGYYFLVRIKKSDTIPAGSRWQVQVLRPGQRKPDSFELPVTAQSSVHQLGLTGTDWPDPKQVPVAWKVTLLAPDGKTVVTHQSFLWD